MPRSTPLVDAMAMAMAVAACHATEGDIFRTRPDASNGADAPAARPRPLPLASWQIQLTGTLDTTPDVAVYIADLETPASVISELHAAGRIAICYFSGGTMEPFRDDASRFPAAALGASLPAYPSERWVDVRDATVRSIMRDRIAIAAGAGCDGVHPSGLAAFRPGRRRREPVSGSAGRLRLDGCVELPRPRLSVHRAVRRRQQSRVPDRIWRRDPSRRSVSEGAQPGSVGHHQARREPRRVSRRLPLTKFRGSGATRYT